MHYNNNISITNIHNIKIYNQVVSIISNKKASSSKYLKKKGV